MCQCVLTFLQVKSFKWEEYSKPGSLLFGDHENSQFLFNHFSQTLLKSLSFAHSGFHLPLNLSSQKPLTLLTVSLLFAKWFALVTFSVIFPPGCICSHLSYLNPEVSLNFFSGISTSDISALLLCSNK